MTLADRLAFIAEWLDPVSGVVWKYQLMFYPRTTEVELFDVKNRRTFLRRSKIEDLHPELFHIGGKVTIYSRQLDIVDYGDTFTKKHLEDAQQKTLAMIKPDAVRHMGEILSIIQDQGFLISKLRMCKLTKQEACQFYAVHQDRPFYDNLTDFMSSGPIIAVQLVAPNAIQRWRELIGPTDTSKAKANAPGSLRARFGTDGTRNACHGSDAPATAEQESEFFFGSRRPGACAMASGTTLCIIKPHAVLEKYVGQVLADISAHFDVICMEMFSVDKASAGEFFEVYRGVVAPSEYSGMVDQLTSGPCIVVELAHRDANEPVESFRELCGPADPEVARVLRPYSLRAKYGVDKNRNAIHCTDLPEDGPLEVNYFFSILAGG